jgi:hypothetical protein
MFEVLKSRVWHSCFIFLLLCPQAFAQAVPPLGELFASDAGSSAQPVGAGMSVYSGSELSAGIAPATLKLARGGRVRICPHSALNVTAGDQGLVLAMGAGAVEVNYELGQQAADVLITPDFNIGLVGPGTFHFALGVNKRGDTCVKPLPGNTTEVSFSELLGTASYKTQPNEAMIFGGGKLDAKTALTNECGCPPAAPVIQTAAQPGPKPTPSKDVAAPPTPTESLAVADGAPTAPLPPDKPGQVHVEVDAPFVFSARPATGRPYSVAKVQFSTLPNVYFAQEKVDPVVLIQKPSEVSLKASVEPPKPPEEKPKKEKKGFFGRVKGFFGSIFHR